jgi:hypothetical protein
MIVRINQFDPPRARQLAGWGDDSVVGEMHYGWPTDTHAFELVILESDEQQQRLTEAFRQRQLRQLLPEVISTFREPGEAVVLRLDGPLLRGELLGAMLHLTEPTGAGRFALGAVEKLDASPRGVCTSVRIHAPPERIAAICSDPGIGLERSVRLRAICLPLALVNPLLDVSELDDERWAEILPQASFVLSTTRQMHSLHLLTRRFDPVETRTRLMEHLTRGRREDLEYET